MTEEGALGLVHACSFGRQTPFRDQTSLLLGQFRTSFCVALAVHMLSLSARQCCKELGVVSLKQKYARYPLMRYRNSLFRPGELSSDAAFSVPLFSVLPALH